MNDLVPAANPLVAKHKGNPNPVLPKRKKRFDAHVKKKECSVKNVHNISQKILNKNPDLKAQVDEQLLLMNRANERPVPIVVPVGLEPINEDHYDTDSDALPDPEEGNLTADYLEALSRRCLPNADEIEWTDLDIKGRRLVSIEAKRARCMC
jgi:hypothetical protein